MALLGNLLQAAPAAAASGVIVSVPTRWLQSVCGSFEWSGPTFEWRLRLHRQGMYRAVSYLVERHFVEARLASGALIDMLHLDVPYALKYALSGRWRPMQFYDASDLNVIRVTCSRATNASLPKGEGLVQGLVERAYMASSGQEVVGVASDASIDQTSDFGSSVWAVHVPLPAEPAAGAAAPATSNRYEVLFRSVERREGDSSGTLELEPWVAVLERHGAAFGSKLLVMIGDNVGNMYRVNRGRVQRGTQAHRLLARIYDLADMHNINFVAFWLPRAANQLLDSISKCRTLADAQARTQAAGVQFVAV
jgi:hypothetical protein